METSFSRTLRSLRCERSRLAFVAPALAAALLACWGTWFVRAPVNLYALTPSARLEVEASARRVAALCGGRVTALHVALGERVRAGDVLFELDAEEARIALEGARNGLPALDRQLAALEREITAEEERAAMLERAGCSELEELSAGIRSALASAESARDEAERSERLHAMGLIADGMALRLEKQADGEESQSEALHHQRERRQIELEERREEARARLERLYGERAEVDGDLSFTKAEIERLEHALDEHLVRAPIDGRVGALSKHRPGDVVRAQEELAAVVPDGALHVMAEFPVAEAAGRVAPGQPARMRLDGVPWLQRGALAARVSAVAAEPHGNALCVELELLAPHEFPVPLHHGMTGTVEVAVEEVSPLVLLLRSVGRMLERGRPASFASELPACEPAPELPAPVIFVRERPTHEDEEDER